MEWLKKHWEILVASAAGILVLYWLYKTYQANQAASAQATQDATANADALASAQQLANADYGGYYSGSGGGSYSGSTIAPPQTTQPVVSQPVAQVQPVNSAPVYGQDFMTPPANQNPDYSYSQNPSVANNPNPIYAPGSPQAIALGYSTAPITSPFTAAISAILGSGGGSNDTAPVAVQATVPDLSHISNGTIPSHTTLVKSPTNTELASLGGRI